MRTTLGAAFMIRDRIVSMIVCLICLLAGTCAFAASINPSDPSAILDHRGLTTGDGRASALHLFDFSPFTASNHSQIPGFADPLGTGAEAGLKVFSGKVHFMDLLGNYATSRQETAKTIELPKNALQGINLLDNFLALYLSYDGRAYDTAQLRLPASGTMQRNGLPVTTETSPLSLEGFGSVSKNIKPISLHWTRCPGREKRLTTMRKFMAQGSAPCAVPAVCQCYVI